MVTLKQLIKLCIVPDERILSFIACRPVTILVPRKENFGVKVYSEELRRFLLKNNVDVDVRALNFLGCLRSIFSDDERVFITNLWYLVFGVILKTRSIAILHGFPNASDYGVLKYFLVKIVTRLGTSSSGLVIANSGLTKEINEKFLKINSDVIWNPKTLICDTTSKDDITLEFSYKPNLIFVGRISEAKGFSRLAEHIRENAHFYSQITIIGPDPQHLTEQLKGLTNVNIMGHVPHSEVRKYLEESDIFVSLNFLEPYGLVYDEAAQAGCVVVCPVHCGYAETCTSESVVRVRSSMKKDIDVSMAKARSLTNA